jgi:hypothetical protein
LEKGDRQMTTEAANTSRLVTKVNMELAPIKYKTLLFWVMNNSI